MSSLSRSTDLLLISFLLVLTDVLVLSVPHTKELAAAQILALPGDAQHSILPSHNGGSLEESEFLSGSLEEYGESDVKYGENSRGASDEFAPVVEKTSGLGEAPAVGSSGNGYRIGLGNSTGSMEEMPKFKSVEYETRPAGTLLDEFVTGKLSPAEAANTLPIFLTEPEGAFVVKNRPAVLKCKAAHALQLYFKCSGSSQPPPSTHDKHVDPHTGVHLEEVTATIHRDLVDEYFGKAPFKCECIARSSRGTVKSQSATINIAYIRKQFITSPTSLRVEVGARAELLCRAPDSYPEPKLSWLKNNMPIAGTNEHGPTVSATGTLVFQQVSLQDMANYTCSAENIAGKRISESAVLIIYVNGGWSSWSPWRECKCTGKPSQGRKRTRTCTNPVPMNGGAQCSGPQIQKSQDCISCAEDTQIIGTDGFDIMPNKRSGRWSAWSEWSACSSDCIQIRRRKCITNAADDVGIGGVGVVGSLVSIPGASNMHGIGATNGGDSGGGGGGSSMIVGGNGGGLSNGGNVGSGIGYGKSLCSGKDIQTAECRGDHCHIGKDDFDWTLYLGLAFITAVCLAFCAALICCARRGIGANPHYNMARTVMDSEYLPGADKKEMRMHIEAVSYDYANPGHRYLPNDHHIVGCNMSEHHYDVPNLAANYTNPIDELSVDYRTDTPDTSTADTSNSTYDIAVKMPATPTVAKHNTSELLGSAGGALRLYGGELMLYIPELAIGKNMKKHVSLQLLGDDSTRVSIMPSMDGLLTCSTVVCCTPRSHTFLKPVILKIPHCLLEPELWHVHIYHADNEHDDLNVAWRKILLVGEETINTPVFVQLEPTHVYIMTEQLGRFVVVAEPKGSTNFAQPSLKMKLIVFSQLTPSSSNCSLRVYVVKDFPNSRHICAAIESQLGGSYMGESDPFAFHLNNCNLSIRVHLNDADVWETQSVELHEQVIPYQHILGSNTILHCEFSIKRNGGQLANAPLALAVEFAQLNDTIDDDDDADEDDDDEHNCDWHTFAVPRGASASPTGGALDTTVSIDRQGNYVNDTNVLGSIQLPRVTKRRICVALDPPRADERDWRLLAHKLNSDRYIAYFATKPSPTEQILNLWECRASEGSTNTNTILELLMTLKDMERTDVMEIIKETIGPLWI